MGDPDSSNPRGLLVGLEQVPCGLADRHERRGLYAHYPRLTLNVAQLLAKLNPEMTFCYVTGAGTDSTEQGRVAWARVKGATENALMRLFKQAYMFRPAFMKATAGQKNLKSYYKLFAWLYPIGRALYPAGFCTLQEVGRAMINAVSKGYPRKILEVKDIVKLANA
jgi:hypothetical protein